MVTLFCQREIKIFPNTGADMMAFNDLFSIYLSVHQFLVGKNPLCVCRRVFNDTTAIFLRVCVVDHLLFSILKEHSLLNRLCMCTHTFILVSLSNMQTLDIS